MQQTIEAELRATEAQWLDFAQIVPSSANDRTVFSPADLEQLAGSIREHGLIEPLLVRPHPVRRGMYEIVAGERRWRACGLAGYDPVLCVIRPLSDEQASIVMFQENDARVNLDPIDEANAYAKRMQQFGWDDATCAKKLEVKGGAARVRERLALLNLTEDIQRMVRKRRLPLGHAALLTDLRPSFQVLALKPFVEGRIPPLRVFRERVDVLRVAQDQTTLFGADEVEVHDLPALLQPLQIDVPSASLPPLPNVKNGNVGRVLAAYARQLHAAGDPAAPIVAHVVNELVRLRWTAL